MNKFLNFKSNCKNSSDYNSDYQSLRIVESFYEDYYLKTRDCSIITRFFRINTLIDYNYHTELVNESIVELKRIHPFLNTQVKICEKTNQMYFVEELNETKNDLKNVEFLELRAKDSNNNFLIDESKYNEITHMLCEREVNNDFKIEEELLWRVIFFKRFNSYQNTNTNNFSYDIILSCNHSISEDRSLIKLMLELLNIIELKFKNSYKNELQYRILPSIKNYIKDTCITHFDYLIKPSFLNKNELARYEKILNILKKDDIETLQLWSTKSSSIYLEIKSLVDIFNQGSSETKFLEFNSQKLNMLKSNCKKRNLKINTCLNAIALLAFRNLYEKYGIDDQEKYRNITYGNCMSLRGFINDPKNFGRSCFENLGYFIAHIPDTFKYSIKFKNLFKSNPEKFSPEFWKLAKEIESKFSDFFKSGNIFNKQPHETKFMHESDFFMDFWITNVGNLPNQFASDTNYAVESSYIYLSYDVFYNMGYLHFSTINEKLIFSFSYNNQLMKKELVDDLLQFFLEIFNFITD